MPTSFWWDNYDRNVDAACGGGSIHNTPGIAFQEHSVGTEYRQENINILKTNRRSLELPKQNPVATPKIDPKKNPKQFTSSVKEAATTAVGITRCEALLTLWKFMRYGTAYIPSYPRFVRFLINLYQVISSTAMTYLPNIQTPYNE